MPHSSGGGSHGGGSHGGSHHSSSRSHSSGSSGPSNKVSNKAFPGAKRYVYFENKAPVFIYSNYNIHKRRTGERLYVIFSYLLIMTFVSAIGIFPFAHFPKKLDTSTYTSTIEIADTIHIIDDKAGLAASLKEFQDETGITPALITVHNEDWEKNYVSLEAYAYDLYVNAYPDEMHWLIVYSEPTDPDPDFNDWKWEGMQGDDTDDILGDRETSLFNRTLHDNLLRRSQYTVDEAVSNAFDTLTPVAMKKYIPKGAIIPLAVINGFLLFFCLISLDLHPKKERLYRKAVECPEQFVDQEACEYCGGIYIVGLNTTCPSCGAPVKPHDYTVDKEGNVTNIIK